LDWEKSGVYACSDVATRFDSSHEITSGFM
jgi:hypothetical protein